MSEDRALPDRFYVCPVNPHISHLHADLYFSGSKWGISTKPPNTGPFVGTAMESAHITPDYNDVSISSIGFFTEYENANDYCLKLNNIITETHK